MFIEVERGWRPSGCGELAVDEVGYHEEGGGGLELRHLVACTLHSRVRVAVVNLG